jgi:NAD+ synthase (glutamine-hydrolysing)
MKLIRVAAGVLNQTPLDWIGNKANILAAIERARQDRVSILVLPELCLSGYGCEDAFHSRGLQETSLEMLLAVVQHTAGIVVSVGLPLAYAGGLFNVAALLVDRTVSGFVAKQHLAGDGIHYEPRWFKRWPEGVHARVDVAGQSLPIGDLLFDVGSVRIGFEVCEDAWVGSRPGSSLASRGADVILNPSASHFAFGKHQIRQRFVLEGSRAFFVTYCYTNLVGNEAGRAIYDGDAMIAHGGNLVAGGQRFSFEPVQITAATVDVDATRMSRAQSGSFEPEVDGDESDVIRLPFSFPRIELQPPELSMASWESGPRVKEEEFTRAVSLGLFDYVRKSRSRGVVISLSGGADSAAVAMLASFMLKFACCELGFERASCLIWPDPASRPKDLSSLTRSLITTVYQRTRNSGEVTLRAAREIAAAAGAHHLEFDVDGLCQSYVSMVSDALARPLDWATDDIALQNIQARVRSPGVWMLANLAGALLLSTSNRSEAAVGYATMDGDTSGGLAPIAGIDKAFLLRWLAWVETAGPQGLHKVPELAAINCQQPTAELRPPGFRQTDEADLMPYNILDAIERLAIRDKRTPIEIFEHLRIGRPDVTADQLTQWIIRFFRLFCRNQWKRERYAPSFHLDDENLDPRSWCRFPILSGGYEYEINQLEQWVETRAKEIRSS